MGCTVYFWRSLPRRVDVAHSLCMRYSSQQASKPTQFHQRNSGTYNRDTLYSTPLHCNAESTSGCHMSGNALTMLYCPKTRLQAVVRPAMNEEEGEGYKSACCLAASSSLSLSSSLPWYSTAQNQNAFDLGKDSSSLPVGNCLCFAGLQGPS